MSTLKLSDKSRRDTCLMCGKQDAIITCSEGCVHCSAENCFKKIPGPKICDFRQDQPGYYFPCFNYPICLALRDGDPNWREVQPAEEVPYQVLVEK